jgi:UDP-glucose 4-epimerase
VSEEPLPYRSVLVTGASGYIGSQVVDALSRDPRNVATIVATDVRAPAHRNPNVDYVVADVRSADFAALFRRYSVDLVVHLAAIVTPGKRASRELEYEVDVVGTENVLLGCRAAGVKKLIYASSGAAYGYHSDNPPLIAEDDALRGNAEFAYAHHKRLVEEMLARWRGSHPELLQLIFRPGTILGADTHNQITDLFDRGFVLGVAGVETPFVFVWDHDVVEAILRGIHHGGTGAFNLAGDGTISLREVASLMHKPYLALAPSLMGVALGLLKSLGLTQYGPEQVRFLRYRPVLDNRRLKQDFGYVPRKTTRQAFEYFMEARRHAQ